MRAAAILVASIVGGCLSAPTLGQPKCSHDSDCPIAGESCQMGVCWGAPPAATFAAAIAPPAERTDLFATELAQVSIGQDGWVDGLMLEAPVTMTGTVVPLCSGSACNAGPIAAQVELVRPSRIPGQPALQITAASDPAAANGAASWHAELPPTDAGDPPYTITVVPDPSGRALTAAPATPTAAQLYPPARFSSAATTSPQRFELGSQIVVSGTLTDATGAALHDYRVVAIGRWDVNEAPREVSTVAYSTDGHYAITVSSGLTGPIEVIAESFDPMVVAPVLHLVPIPAQTATHTLAQPAAIGAATNVQISVVGQATNGNVGPVIGASVVLHAEVAPPVGSINGTGATFAAQATTDASGTVTLSAPQGDAFAYKLQVVPPAGSSLGVIYDQPFSLAVDPGKPQTLPSRVAIHGTVTDASGHPLDNVTVTASPALRFLWTLDPATLHFVSNIPAATTVTSGGDFVVWVDPYIGDPSNFIWGFYDLAFQPPSSASAPRWTLGEVEIPRVTPLADFSIPTAQLPDAAYVHGVITDPNAAPLAGAQLSIYELATDTSLCAQLQRPANLCIVPATLGGRGTSDVNGTAPLTLPRSP